MCSLRINYAFYKMAGNSKKFLYVIPCESKIMSPDGLDGLGTRNGTTVITAVSWLAFIILYLAFWTGDFNIWQNIAVFLASFLIMGGLIGVMWITWGTKKFVEA